MKPIEYRKGSVFQEAAPNVMLAHACNAKGVWGSGVALEFASRYPEAYAQYRKECMRGAQGNPRRHVGKFFPVMDGNLTIGCLITSASYGDKVDPPDKILNATYESAMAATYYALNHGLEIHSPKINSVRFKTPWYKTEEMINEALRKHPTVKWVVWEYEE